MSDIITLSRERGLFVHPHTAVILLSSRSLDKNSVKQDGGFMLGATMLKRCSKCKKWKLRSEFNKRKDCQDGLQYVCKSCDTENSREWCRANPEKHLKQVLKWRFSNPEKVREGKRKQYVANPKKHHKWRGAHPEKIQEYNHTYYVAHKEKIHERDGNRRARVKGNGGKFTNKEWQALKEFYNFTCLCCRRREPEIKLTRDHIKPLELGGANSIDNIQPLCKSCNSRKHTNHVDYR